MPLQGENRNVSDDDDEHREERGPTNLHGRIQNGAAGIFTASGGASAFARPLSKRSKHVFDDDDGAVDDDAEVHRAKRQQVRRNAANSEADEGAQQRQRDDGRHNCGRAGVAQEDVQHERDEQRAFEQVPEYRRQRRCNEPRTVVVRHDPDVARQHRMVQVVDPFLDVRQDFRRVLAFSHQHGPGHDLVLIVLADQTLARNRADGDVGEVADEQRRAVVFRDHDRPDVIGRSQQADAANKILLLPLVEIIAAGVRVSPAQRAEHLLKGDAVRFHAREIEAHLVLLDEAAAADDVGDAGRQLERALDDPVFNAPKLSRTGGL